MAYAREIILLLIQWLKFRVPNTGEKDSYYGEIGNTLIRISNHCTRLRVWDFMLENNPQWRGKPIISIVFEDDASTFDEVDCLVLKRFRKKPIKVLEFVYNLGGDANFLDKRDLKAIFNSMRIISNGNFSDWTGKCQPPVMRISQNPNRYNIPTNITDVGGTYQSAYGHGADYVSESKNIYKYNQNNCNRNMKNKKVVRLTESQLHNIIAESVKKILKEEGIPGSLIHGTHQNEDLIPVFMSEIFRNNPQKAKEIWQSSPNLLKALCDQKAGKETNWWDSEEATEICFELQDELQNYAPEGHYFGTHMGDGSDFGYWNDEDNDI